MSTAWLRPPKERFRQVAPTVAVLLVAVLSGLSLGTGLLIIRHFKADATATSRLYSGVFGGLNDPDPGSEAEAPLRLGEEVRAIDEAGADWITFLSGSSVEHFHGRVNLPALMKKHPRIQLASIGPETSKALASLGLRPTVEPALHTTSGVIEAMGGRVGARASELGGLAIDLDLPAARVPAGLDVPIGA